MLVTNTTSNYYYLGDSRYPLPPGGATTVPNQTYNDNDAIAKAINGLDETNIATVSSAPTGYPRSVGTSAGTTFETQPTPTTVNEIIETLQTLGLVE